MHIRDPFILPFDGKYYIYSQPGKYAWHGYDGFYCSVSEDLEEWTEPKKCFDPPEGFWATNNYWAPEVHYYKGKFYLIASFNAVGHMRASQILASDSPEGPFEVWSCPLTPNNWKSLDGTLYIEDDIPYMIFSHEWSQVKDGEMCAIRLSDDLKTSIGEPILLFKASESGWSTDEAVDGFITDGPFLYKTKSGRLIMTWSSCEGKRYSVGVAYSSNNSILGEWLHCKKTLSNLDGGHGMIFKSFNNKLYFAMHTPNNPNGAERPRLFAIEEIDEEPFLKLI